MRMFRLANGWLPLLCQLFRFRLPNATASLPGSASFGVPSLESLAAWVVRPPCDVCRPYWKYVQGSPSFPDRFGALIEARVNQSDPPISQHRTLKWRFGTSVRAVVSSDTAHIGGVECIQVQVKKSCLYEID